MAITIKFTKEFREKAIFAENGTKFVLRGFVLLPEFDGSDVENLTLKELVETYEDFLITDEKKRGTDILEKVFDLQFIPNLELKTENGDRFGSYKIVLNKNLNSSANYSYKQAEAKGTKNTTAARMRTDRLIKAVALIGESYTESATYIKSNNKSFLAAVIQDEFDFKNEDKAVVINLQLSLTIADEFTTESIQTTELDDAYWHPNVEAKNATEITWDTTSGGLKDTSTWFIPSGTAKQMETKIGRYKNILKKNGLDAEHIENIDWQPYTLVLAPVTDRNENIYNIKCRINIWDDRSGRFTKPQMLLSVDDDEHGHIGVEADETFFSFNEKGGDGYTNFDLFSRDTNFQSSAFQGQGLCKICGQDDKAGSAFSLPSQDVMFLGTRENEAKGLRNSSFIFSNENKFYGSDINVFASSNLDGNYINESTFIESKNLNMIDDRILAIGAQGRMDTSLNASLAHKVFTDSMFGFGAILVGENQFTVSDVSHNDIFIGHKGLLAKNKPFIEFSGHAEKKYGMWLDTSIIPSTYTSIYFNKFNCNDSNVEPVDNGETGKDHKYAQYAYNNIMVAVGDGYYHPAFIPDPETYDKVASFTSGDNQTNAQYDPGEIMKRLNVFSVESQSWIPKVHYNDYDNRDNTKETYGEVNSYFAARGWHTDVDDVIEGNIANQHNALFSPDAIYFTKDRYHNEEWKLRIKELELFVRDNYVKDPNTTLNTSDLDKMMKRSIKGTNVFTLPLEPKFHYTITRPGRHIEGYTKGICGKYGVKGVYARRDALPGDDWKIHFDQKDDIITLGDMVRAINTIHDRKIGYDMLNGTDKNTYQIYAYNASLEQIWIKGIRTRAYSANNDKRYQTLVKMNYVEPGVTYGILYVNDGHHDKFGVMNWDFNTEEDNKSHFLT